MNSPGHVMILASAGSGKTYALTNRFVRLLAGGAAPERIVALTFTRKAAGEFFDEILHKLARAAGDAAAAKKLSADIGIPGLSAADYLRMLRQVIEAMPRLSLGTLDGFFARIVRSFPLELGLGGEFTLLEEASARMERRRVLSRLFSASGEPTAAQKEFIEAFKRATFGVEEKQLSRRLERFLDDHTEAYLDAPNAEVWGNARRIWPEHCEWLDAALPRDQAVQALRAALPWDGLNDKQRARLNDFFELLPTWLPGAPLPKPVDYVVTRALAVWPDLLAGRAEMVVERKKVALNPEACAALAATVRTVVGSEITRKLEMTRGLFSVLHGYEAIYHDAVRRGGRMTFADVQRLLLPGAGAPLLSGEDAGEARLLIDWRLDAQFDHWLLDEFQDTSFSQWSILKNLLDEVVQDPEKARTLFYVGDVKQAIYAWREGDPRLFREIFDYYNQTEAGAIAEEHLTDSWRSGPAVISMVNRVFGDETALRALVPPEAAKRWSADWRNHRSARPQLGGFATLRQAEDEAARFAETLKILNETEPLARGLSVAVIVQKNDTGARLADYLRSEGGLPAVAESDLHIAMDNPLGCALLALLRVAAHPGDRLARQHLAMTPLGTILVEHACKTEDQLTQTVLAEIFEVGFAATLEKWLRAVEPYLAADDQFSRLRGRQLVDAARKFDENGRRDVAEFLAWAEGSVVRDADTAAVIRVLTVHKSKGLGFDLVILPDLQGKSLSVRRDGLAVKKAADRSVEWVLDLPGKIFAEHDEVLAAHMAAQEADAAYEALCKYYVALTRAKRALYVITEPVGTSVSQNFPKLLEQTLGEVWSDGDARWFDELQPEKQDIAAADVLMLAPERAWERLRRLPSRRASDGKAGHGLISLFQTEGRAAADFGTQVHALFESVEWWDRSMEGDWVAARRRENVEPAVLKEVLACLNAPGLSSVFQRPNGVSDVWRERAFEVVLDGVWVTGVFDRVVVCRSADGRVDRAEIFDFKTDVLRGGDGWAASEQRHSAQLRLYRRVVEILTGLESVHVGILLVMTKGPTLLRVD